MIHKEVEKLSNISPEVRLKIIMLSIRYEQQLRMLIRGYNHNDLIRSKL